MIVLILIVILTIITLCSNRENFDTTRHCYNRNKEYLDYKDKIYNRVEDLAEIEINDIISEREKFYLKSNIVVDNNINDIELTTEKIISLIKNYNS